MAWTDLSGTMAGSSPSTRYGHGFISAGDKLYVCGGFGVGSTIGKNGNSGISSRDYRILSSRDYRILAHLLVFIVL
jgi:hypothetical protein